MIRYFLLSSLLLLVACATLKTPQQQKMPCVNRTTFNWDTTLVYKASITVMNQNISGLIIFNKEDETTYRLVMTTDIGPKLIDMTLTPKGYTKNFIISQLDRKALLRMFWEDFSTMLGIFSYSNYSYNSGIDSCCYPVPRNFSACYNPNEQNSFPSTAYFLKGNEKQTKINYFCLPEHQPDSIKIEHLRFNMSYFLNKLN